MENMCKLNYQSILNENRNDSIENVVALLLKVLPQLWCQAYLDVSPRSTSLVSFTHGSFHYIYDDFASLIATGTLPDVSNSESRLVAVHGQSSPRDKARDDYRLRGWVGPTESTFGPQWDKGHFIAHSIGGAVDGIEANVFLQRRDLNRGWSTAGKLFRDMEQYCAKNPGTFCFNRPIYVDQTAIPAYIEFGLLKQDCKLWVECFDNR